MRMPKVIVQNAIVAVAALLFASACGASNLVESVGGAPGVNAAAVSSNPNDGAANAPSPTAGGNGNGFNPGSGAAQQSSGTVLMGILPDYDNSNTNGVTGFIARTKVTPKATSGYVDVGPNGTIQTSTGIGYIDEAKKNGASIVSLSLSAIQTGSLTTDQLAGLQAMVDEAQAQKIELWFRYGYEMNYGGGTAQYQRIDENNDPNDFLAQWSQVAAMANPMRKATYPVKMFWSPNIYSGGDLPYSSWFPTDPNTVDVVGVDWYHTMGDEISTSAIVASLADVYAFSAQYHLPFMLGETAVITQTSSTAEADEKMQWLTALVAADLRVAMPYYQGFFWFDYEKDGTNFSISQDTYVVSLFEAFFEKTFGTGSAS